MLWSLRSNRRHPIIGLMPRSTTLNWYTQTNCGPGMDFHSMLSHSQPGPSSARNFMLS